MSDGQSPGQFAYINYGNAMHWESDQDTLMPRWADLSGRERDAWEAAARAAAGYAGRSHA